MPGGACWTTTRECPSTVRSVTNASLGWATVRWVRWASRSFSTTNASIPSGCATSVRHNGRMAVFLMWRQPSGTTIRTMWLGRQHCPSRAICCGDSMVTASPSSTAIPISKSGCSISSRNIVRTGLFIAESMPTGVYRLKSWSSSIRKTPPARPT